ncbi:helix-turn-helix domain-containing protein [Streptosporangium sp. NPDC050855]|uniref:helix-turn-helix domain-containing protein n=1 Tax=Streptosporangium sp. NPDC050855 TaxID=3366194 RepID=UPI0037A93DDE
MEQDRLATLDQVIDNDPMAGLALTVETRREMERLEAVLVRRARTRGRSWAEIAEVLGISRQAVHKKHGGRRLFRSED